MPTLTHITANLGSLDEWKTFVLIYRFQITLGAVLSALTIYRKQLSSNRCFHEEEKEEEAQVQMQMHGDHSEEEKVADQYEPSSLSYEFEVQAEELLDAAGFFCSGAPIRSIMTHWLDRFPSEDVEGLSSKLWLYDDELTTADLLEKAGNYYSVELLAAMLFFTHSKQNTAALEFKEEDPFAHTFPPDIHVHIASYLHPKDVTTLSCVSRGYNKVVSNSETSKAIWRSLWMRDFSWLVRDWDVGIQALRRSGVGMNWEQMDKTFYFLFRQTYLNWIIAGENTPGRCLVGLYGNIFDISSFLNAHPGSPDTLMVHSGQDATRYFEDINHSNSARRLAKSLCIVMDLASVSEEEWGVWPTSTVKLLQPPERTADPSDPRLMRRGGRKGLGTLAHIKELLAREQQKVERQVAKDYASNSKVLGGQVNSYFDPFRREWRVWYTNFELENVFAPA